MNENYSIEKLPDGKVRITFASPQSKDDRLKDCTLRMRSGKVTCVECTEDTWNNYRDARYIDDQRAPQRSRE